MSKVLLPALALLFGCSGDVLDVPEQRTLTVEDVGLTGSVEVAATRVERATGIDFRVTWELGGIPVSYHPRGCARPKPEAERMESCTRVWTRGEREGLVAGIEVMPDLGEHAEQNHLTHELLCHVLGGGEHPGGICAEMGTGPITMPVLEKVCERAPCLWLAPETGELVRFTDDHDPDAARHALQRLLEKGQ
jgi:hypothetical protein